MNNQSSMHQLPVDIAEQLLCAHCNCYISSGPVKMQPDGGSICGRCSPSSSEVFGRNVLFETAMSKFTFPCRYKAQGCNQSILFGKTAEHEDACPYQTFLCPSLLAGICSENLTVFNVYKHFNENHLDLITKDGRFKLDLEQSFQNNLLMMVDDIVVIIQYNYDKNRNVLNLNVAHWSNDNLQTLHYKTQIVSGLDTDRILHFKELQCPRYQSRTIIEPNENNLKMSNYLPALDNPPFIFVDISVTIRNNNSAGTNIPEELVIELPVRTETSLLSSVPSPTENNEDIERALQALDNVRCYFCVNYCIPPIFEGIIYNSTMQHGIFNNIAQIKVISCSKCTHGLNNPTQKAYEQLTYPCRWRACAFIGNERNIAKHDEDCLFRKCLCPVDACKQKFFLQNNLMQHMLGHGTYIPDPHSMIIKLYDNERRNVDPIVYYTVFEKKLVTFTFSLENDEWVLTCKGCIDCTVDIHFEHAHCRVKSKKQSKTDNFVFRACDVNKISPPCFKICNDVEAIITVRKK